MPTQPSRAREMRLLEISPKPSTPHDATLTRARDETVTTGGHILDDVAVATLTRARDDSFLEISPKTKVATLTRARDETITPNSGALKF